MSGQSDGEGEWGEFKLSFVFVPEGDPPPTAWMAEHPDWVRIPALMVPHEEPHDRVGGDGRAPGPAGAVGDAWGGPAPPGFPPDDGSADD